MQFSKKFEISIVKCRLSKENNDSSFTEKKTTNKTNKQTNKKKQIFNGYLLF